MIYVRKRNYCFLVRLTQDEMNHLTRQVNQTNLSREDFVRSLISKAEIRSRVPMDLVSVLKNLQQINNNMNQIAMKANSLNFVDTAAYWENIESLEEVKGKLLEVMYG